MRCFLRKERPDSLKDERELIGKTIWVSAGGQMDHYKDTGKHVDYAKPAGVLLGAEPLVIKDVFEEKAPANSRATFRIAPGQRQVLLAFTMPKSSDPNALYAVPVGNFDEGSTTSLLMRFFSMMIRMSCTSTGDRRCGRTSTSMRRCWG